MSFAKLKQQSGKKSLEQLTTQLTKLSGTQESKSDDRFWYPEVDKAGNGYAIIRFLPAPGSEDVPFVRVWGHGFKGKSTGLWYIENSLSTIGKPDPVGEYNTQLWNSTTDDNSPARKQARDQKRKLTYISNVYVVSDPAKPQNEGKVFLFKYGKKIFDKLKEAMEPQFADEEAINPFDLWAGANFKLKIRNLEGYRNYDKSEFADKSALYDGDDAKLEELWKKEYSLAEFVEKKQFKSYEQLKGRLDKVLGFDGAQVASSRKATDEPISLTEADVSALDNVEQDEDLDYFKSLATS